MSVTLHRAIMGDAYCNINNRHPRRIREKQSRKTSVARLISAMVRQDLQFSNDKLGAKICKILRRVECATNHHKRECIYYYYLLYYLYYLFIYDGR